MKPSRFSRMQTLVRYERQGIINSAEQRELFWLRLQGIDWSLVVIAALALGCLLLWSAL